MKIRKILASVLAFAALCISACSCEAEQTTLKIGSEINYPPFEYYDTDGVTKLGVDVELGQALAEKMGMEAQIIDTLWEGIFDGLDRGEYDCVIAAITVTPERLEDYELSDSYIQNYQCIVTAKDAEVKPASPDEIGGLSVGFQSETVSSEFITGYAETNGIEFTPTEYSKMNDAFSELEAGRLDAVVCDSTVAGNFISDNDGFEITWQGDEPEEFAVCIKKGNTELLEKVNKAMAELKAEGKIDEILGKYF